MKHLYYTYVDAKTGIPCLAAPMRNGPAHPAVDGLLFGFALESRYPTPHPVFYGTCPDESSTDASGVLGVISEAEYEQALADEMTARRAKLKCTARQARLALIDAGLLESVPSAIASIEDATARAKAEVEWEYASHIERLSPWVIQLGGALGLDDDGLDQLFQVASGL
jgi:hypothetical protein